jgi:hypothetical protein
MPNISKEKTITKKGVFAALTLCALEKFNFVIMD